MSPIDALVAELDQELKSTRALLKAVPAEHLGARPVEKMFSVGDLAMHIASLMDWGHKTVVADDLDLTDYPGPASPTTPEDYLSRFERDAPEFRAALTALKPEDLATIWTLRTGDQVHLALPRGAVLRGFVFSHLYHHRGQMTVFLRLLGAKVPGMYGPTADDMPPSA